MILWQNEGTEMKNIETVAVDDYRVLVNSKDPLVQRILWANGLTRGEKIMKSVAIAMKWRGIAAPEQLTTLKLHSEKKEANKGNADKDTNLVKSTIHLTELAKAATSWPPPTERVFPQCTGEDVAEQTRRSSRHTAFPHNRNGLKTPFHYLTFLIVLVWCRKN